MDITTLSLAKKYANKVAAGFSKVEVQGNNLIFTLNDGTKATMTVPTPEKGSDGISIVDVSIDIDGSLLCHMSDGSTINAGKIAEYDEHSQKLDNKIIATRNELERVKNDVLETGTDTDAYIHLEDSAMAEYQELSVDGVCEQETSTGKNLFDESIMPTNTINGIKWEYTNKKIKISGTATDTYSHNENISITLPAGTYYFVESCATNLTFAARFYNINGELIANSQRYNPFTISENATRIELLVKGMTSGTSYNQEMNFMVSTTNGNYEPYTGGQPSPSPDHPQPISTIENSLKITSCNKNLWNVDNIEIGAINQNGVFVSSDVRARAYYQKIQNNDRITISSGISGLSVVPYFYDKNKKFISYNDGWKTMPYTFDTVKDAKYVAFLFKNSSDTINLDELTQIQLEQNPTATEYEQHLETQIQANLPEGEFIGKIDDTYKDTLKVEYNETDGQYHLKLYKYIGKVVLDGSENWFYSSGSTRFGVTSLLDCLETENTRLKIISNYFRHASSGLNDGTGFAYYTGGYKYLYLYKFDTTDVETFKNWLSTHNTEVYYALATPYVVDLGVVDMPITYNEITNLFTDSNLSLTINAKYYRNFISTVRNLQVNEKALKQELIDINTRLSALETAQTSVASESEVVE